MTAKESKAVAFAPEQLAALADRATKRANRNAAKMWPPGHDREVTARNLQQRYYAEYVTPAKMTYAAMQSALHAAEAENARLRVENRIKSRAVDRWVPCPDHRDKTDDQGCYACRNETLTRKLGELRRRVEKLADHYDSLQHPYCATQLRQLLASHGGADGDSHG